MAVTVTPCCLRFLLEASGVGGFHGCDDLIIVAGGDELGEKLRFFGDRLSGGRRKRHALSLDRGADAGCLAELHRIADEPVGDVDRRAGALTQRQGKCIARRWATIAIDEKSALICRQTPFRLEPWRSQQLQPERGIADGAADIEAVACHGAPAQHRLALRQQADGGDRDGERPEGVASVAADKLDAGAPLVPPVGPWRRPRARAAREARGGPRSTGRHAAEHPWRRDRRG